MIDISIYSEKLDIALRQKSNSSYSKKISSELAKPEWQQKLFELERIFSKIKDDQDFQKYQNTLTKLFDDIYEVITAPGVDDFIAWINELTYDKNNANAKKLRDFLVAHYSETNISESIEIIIASKQALDIENSIFTSLLSEVVKELKKETTTLLNEPKQFENNIDSYFDSITSTLKGLNEINELTYTSKEQLYSEEQIRSKIGFYDTIISLIIAKGQILKAQVKEEESQTTLSRLKWSISEIKKGIQTLYGSNVASNEDLILKEIFLKLDKEINFEKGIAAATTKFINETWVEIEGCYLTMRDFFNEKVSITYNTSWDTFAKKGAIISLVDEYNQIAKINILINISTMSADETIKQLKSKAPLLEKYSEFENKLKLEIESEFSERIAEYGSKSKKQLLENLSAGNRELETIKKNIESNLEGLKGGIVKLKAAKTLILFLKDDFSYVLNNLNDVRTSFELFLQKSHMEKHLAWVDTKCNSSTAGTVTAMDLNDPNIIKELLEKDLIKIEIQKKY